jgi:Ca-activated chloride channel family protein
MPNPHESFSGLCRKGFCVFIHARTHRCSRAPRVINHSLQTMATSTAFRAWLWRSDMAQQNQNPNQKQQGQQNQQDQQQGRGRDQQQQQQQEQQQRNQRNQQQGGQDEEE